MTTAAGSHYHVQPLPGTVKEEKLKSATVRAQSLRCMHSSVGSKIQIYVLYHASEHSSSVSKFYGYVVSFAKSSETLLPTAQEILILRSAHNSVVHRRILTYSYSLAARDLFARLFENVLVVERTLPRRPRRQGSVVVSDQFVLGVLEQGLGQDRQGAHSSLGEEEQPADEWSECDVGYCRVLCALE
jgi:hypothetical protein